MEEQESSCCYYAYLRLNLAMPPKPHPRCEICVSRDPDEEVFLLNELKAPSEHCWVMVQSLGPFTKQEKAEEFATMWRERARRPEWLIAKGFSLMQETLATNPNLSIRITPLSAEEHAQRLQSRYSVYEALNGPAWCLHPARHHSTHECMHQHPTINSTTSTTTTSPESHVRIKDVMEGWLREEHLLF